MAKLVYTRGDVEKLCGRLIDRAGKMTVRDAQAAADATVASKLLRWMLAQGIPPTTIEIETNNEGSR